MNEHDERLPVGPRGEPGPQGEQGLSRLQGRAVVVLFLLAALCGVGNLFWTAHEVSAASAAQHAEQVAQQRQAAREESAQRRAAAAVLAKVCTSFARQAALKPPPGNPKANPSRAWEQGEHAILAQLGPDLGCRK